MKNRKIATKYLFFYLLVLFIYLFIHLFVLFIWVFVVR